jgi:hypothetical protein
VLEDALKQNEKVREFYFTARYNHTCLVQQPVRIYEDDEPDRKKYLTREIYTNVVVCTFNENERKRTFFLASDPREEFSVFVLEKNVDTLSASELIVVGHVRNISLIKYAKMVY